MSGFSYLHMHLITTEGHALHILSISTYIIDLKVILAVVFYHSSIYSHVGCKVLSHTRSVATTEALNESCKLSLSWTLLTRRRDQLKLDPFSSFRHENKASTGTCMSVHHQWFNLPSDCTLRSLEWNFILLSIIQMESELVSEYLHFYMQRKKHYAFNLPHPSPHYNSTNTLQTGFQ